jgi:hypothetical protein
MLGKRGRHLVVEVSRVDLLIVPAISASLRYFREINQRSVRLKSRALLSEFRLSRDEVCSCALPIIYVSVLSGLPGQKFRIRAYLADG